MSITVNAVYENRVLSTAYLNDVAIADAFSPYIKTKDFDEEKAVKTLTDGISANMKPKKEVKTDAESTTLKEFSYSG